MKCLSCRTRALLGTSPSSHDKKNEDEYSRHWNPLNNFQIYNYKYETEQIIPESVTNFQNFNILNFTF